jgi:hypothetical protein
VTLKSRLKRLTQQLGLELCPECRDRRGCVVLVVSSLFADGTVTAQNDAPRPCSRCGEVPEQAVHVVEQIVVARRV